MNVTHEKCLLNKTRLVTDAVSSTTPKTYLNFLLLWSSLTDAMNFEEVTYVYVVVMLLYFSNCIVILEIRPLR